jgi:hypothetical protein
MPAISMQRPFDAAAVQADLGGGPRNLRSKHILDTSAFPALGMVPTSRPGPYRRQSLFLRLEKVFRPTVIKSLAAAELGDRSSDPSSF